jgi:hypothetical protein
MQYKPSSEESARSGNACRVVTGQKKEKRGVRKRYHTVCWWVAVRKRAEPEMRARMCQDIQGLSGQLEASKHSTASNNTASSLFPRLKT